MNSREVLREKLYGNSAMSVNSGNRSVIESGVPFSMGEHHHRVGNPIVLLRISSLFMCPFL
jgi:hypothetical protein